MTTDRRPEAVALQLERMDRFDAALVRVLGWGTVAIAVTTAVALVLT